MATVRVPIDRFRDRRFPAVCAVSGVPAAETFELRAGRGGALRGGVPLHGDVVRAVRLWRQLMVLTGAAMVLLVIGALITGSAAMAAASGVCFVASALALAQATMQLPGGRIVGNQVELRRVHTGFVSALTTPPSKCDGCTGASSCSVAEMDACDGVAATAGDQEHHAQH